MHLTYLQVLDFRNFPTAELTPCPGINWLSGSNGAGKTSLLEAIYLLSRGRSFRSNSSSALIRDGAAALTVFARGENPAATLGMMRSRGSAWQGKINGQVSQRVSQFARMLPVVLIEPSNHALVHGGPDIRRAFMDWGMFHVEPDYLQTWRRYSRLLHQRNAALKTHASDAVLDALEQLMDEAANAIDRERGQYVEALKQETTILHEALGLQFDHIGLEYPPKQNSVSYLDHWRQNRSRDREHGFTRAGPHRADLKLLCNQRLAAPRLSRGQQKLTALMLLLAQFQVSVRAGRDPVLLLDDPTSELDDVHLQQLLAWIQSCPAQVWVAAVAPPGELEAKVFHVEHGRVDPRTNSK